MSEANFRFIILLKSIEFVLMETKYRHIHTSMAQPFICCCCIFFCGGGGGGVTNCTERNNVQCVTFASLIKLYISFKKSCWLNKYIFCIVRRLVSNFMYQQISNVQGQNSEHQNEGSAPPPPPPVTPLTHITHMNSQPTHNMQ